MLDPKTLWRIKTDVNVVPVPPPVPRIHSKGTAVLNARCVGNRTIERKIAFALILATGLGRDDGSHSVVSMSLLMSAWFPS